jgi:hypothetical protein
MGTCEKVQFWLVELRDEAEEDSEGYLAMLNNKECAGL